MCSAGQASMAHFYFDFRDINKQHWHDLTHSFLRKEWARCGKLGEKSWSFLTQLSAQSDPCCDILLHFHSDHGCGAQQPDDAALKRCLIEMLTFPDQPPIYLILDALDECSNDPFISRPFSSALEGARRHSNSKPSYMCHYRPEFDIRDALEPLTSRRVSLHDQSGQKQGIVGYVRVLGFGTDHAEMEEGR